MTDPNTMQIFHVSHLGLHWRTPWLEQSQAPPSPSDWSRSREALRGDTGIGQRLVQPAAQEMQHPAQAAVHLPQGQRDRRARRHGQGLRVRRRTSTSLFTDEELKALEERRPQSIDIAEFVPLAAVDPIYFDKAYYLGPDKGGDKAVLLLARGDAQTGAARSPLRGARQAVPGADPPGGRPGAAAAALRGRGPVAGEVPLPEVEVRGELKLGQAAHRPDRRRDLRPDEYATRSRAHPAGDPAEGARAGHHGGRAVRRARPHHRPDGGVKNPSDLEGDLHQAAPRAAAAPPSPRAASRRSAGKRPPPARIGRSAPASAASS